MGYQSHMTADRLDATFTALADPTRRAILARLALGEAAVTELAAPFAISLPAVSRHLRVLQRCGLLERGRNAQWRPCRLRPEPLQQASAWLEQYRRFWEQSLDRLEDYLRELGAGAPAPQKRAGRSGNGSGNPKEKQNGRRK